VAYDNSNSGCLFRKTDRTDEKQPTFTGFAEVGDKNYWLAAWPDRDIKCDLALAITSQEDDEDKTWFNMSKVSETGYSGELWGGKVTGRVKTAQKDGKKLAKGDKFLSLKFVGASRADERIKDVPDAEPVPEEDDDIPF
jgi:hypothetical protein